MGRRDYEAYGLDWGAPTYSVDARGKVVGGYVPAGPSNWGRWGDGDRRGAANLVTREHILGAAGLVRKGAVFSLALPIDSSAPRWPGRPPHQHYFLMTGSDAVAGSPYNELAAGLSFNDDAINMSLQGSTQWDGLSHFQKNDVLYNGYWAGNITALGGDPFLGIGNLREAGIGRGVLLDVARHLGVDACEPGQVLDPSTLEAVCRNQGVAIAAGDIVLIRTGMMWKWWALETPDERSAYYNGWPGPGIDGGRWLASREVSAVAADNFGFEAIPGEDPDEVYPVHQLFLVDLGISIGELWDMDKLADDCARDGVFEFLLVAPPLYFPTAVGSPLNPIAIK